MKEKLGGDFLCGQPESQKKRKGAMSKNVPDSEESGRYQKG